MKNLIILKIILLLQKMGYFSERFKEHLLVFSCYYQLVKTEMFNCVLDLAYTNAKISSNWNMHASSYYRMTCLTGKGQTIYKLLFKSEMWKKLSSTEAEVSWFIQPAKVGCIEF